MRTQNAFFFYEKKAALTFFAGKTAHEKRIYVSFGECFHSLIISDKKYPRATAGPPTFQTCNYSLKPLFLKVKRIHLAFFVLSCLTSANAS